jgi:hypothetical protein
LLARPTLVPGEGHALLRCEIQVVMFLTLHEYRPFPYRLLSHTSQ